jgi:endonuclease/exonuclease/phosphatase family metal-dependent hydrolase
VWVASAVVVGLAGVVALALGVSDTHGGSSTGTRPPPVVTAPTTPVVTTAPPAGRLSRKLRPLANKAGCIAAARHVRVLQFNIHAGISRSGGLDLTAIADEINALRPDLVSLNEVDSHTFRSRRIDEAEFLAQATGLHAVYGPNLPWEGGLFGNAILSRYPVVGSSNVHLPRIAGLERRGLLTATVRIGRRTLSFSSMHLSNGPGGRVSRVMEARTVAQVVRRSAYPTILAGDLNSRPNTLPVRILRQYLLDAQELGGTGSGDTVPETSPRSRFDYVLYDQSFAVVPGTTLVRPSSVSDHRSVFTDLFLLPRHCGR